MANEVLPEPLAPAITVGAGGGPSGSLCADNSTSIRRSTCACHPTKPPAPTRKNILTARPDAIVLPDAVPSHDQQEGDMSEFVKHLSHRKGPPRDRPNRRLATPKMELPHRLPNISPSLKLKQLPIMRIPSRQLSMRPLFYNHPPSSTNIRSNPRILTSCVSTFDVASKPRVVTAPDMHCTSTVNNVSQRELRQTSRTVAATAPENARNACHPVAPR